MPRTNRHYKICLIKFMDIKRTSHRLVLAMVVTAIALLSTACNTSKKVLYVQDLNPGSQVAIQASQNPITVQPEDKLSIIVNSRDPQLTALFNLPKVNKMISQTSTNGSSPASNNSNDVLGYTVDKNGEIDFPVLGKIKVAGMTREEIAQYIKEQLIAKNLVKDPIVTVEYMNLCFTVIGEVSSPGRYGIDRDHTTIIDAISMAGDLTINGKRNTVKVIRNEDGVQRVYGIDLTSGADIYSSPAYYLQQNDVIYVEPNGLKARQSTVNGNTVRSTAFWFSVISLITSLSVLLFK